jgi:hypothetical protein
MSDFEHIIGRQAEQKETDKSDHDFRIILVYLFRVGNCNLGTKLIEANLIYLQLRSLVCVPFLSFN